MGTPSRWHCNYKGPRGSNLTVFQPPGFSCWTDMVLECKNNDHNDPLEWHVQDKVGNIMGLCAFCKNALIPLGPDTSNQKVYVHKGENWKKK